MPHYSPVHLSDVQRNCGIFFFASFMLWRHGFNCIYVQLTYRNRTKFYNYALQSQHGSSSYKCTKCSLSEIAQLRRKLGCYVAG